MPVCGLPQNKSPTPVRNREVPGRSVMFTYENATEYKSATTARLCIINLIHKLMLSDCIFTPSDSDEEYADSWFNWD